MDSEETTAIDEFTQALQHRFEAIEGAIEAIGRELDTLVNFSGEVVREFKALKARIEDLERKDRIESGTEWPVTKDRIG
jgi:hypothetical protein